MSEVCTATRQDGNRCQAKALAGKVYCWFHCPELAESRKAARRAGGKTRSREAAVLPADVPDVPLGTVGDLVIMLAESVNLTRKGLLDPRVANACGYLCSILHRCLVDSELERRLAELEAKLQQQAVNRNGQHQPHERVV